MISFVVTSFDNIYLLLNKGALYFKGFSCGYACLYQRDN